ncbi:MAG: UDP-3-O-(3-hydroxymyristoyl)glucosamine N-acyltransferase [Alphaproteobacteria bacterium]|nr:UDP-3-O-(3-hydroxymyristoyl)glucosamine N-acyltransferase [Alphaproteobacteria bacterium]
MKLREIAETLDAELVGDGAIEIARVVHPSEAKAPTDLALAMNREMLAALEGSASRVAVLGDDTDLPKGRLDGYILVRRGRYAMAGLMGLFSKPAHAQAGVHPSAVVEDSAEIGEGVSIGPFTYVGPSAVIGAGTILMSHVTVGAEAVLGGDCLIHAGVRIGERVQIGARAIMHHNASIGADGFSFVTPTQSSAEQAKESRGADTVDVRNTTIVRINSIGTVAIGDDVEIGACTSIDRGTISATRVGSGTKIDDLVMIGHNVVVGENCMICGQVGIAGSTVIGDRVVLAGQAGIADHLKIGSDVVVGAGSGVASNIKSGLVVLGYPAVPKSQATELVLNMRRLNSLFEGQASLKKRLKAIESGNEKG